MNAHHDDRRHVTVFGDGPLVDPEGYAVEVSADDEGHRVHVKTALDVKTMRGIRADLTAAQVDDLTDRLIAARDHLKDPK